MVAFRECKRGEIFILFHPALRWCVHVLGWAFVVSVANGCPAKQTGPAMQHPGVCQTPVRAQIFSAFGSSRKAPCLWSSRIGAFIPLQYVWLSLLSTALLIPRLEIQAAVLLVGAI